jgi:hypothetical protein
MSQWDQVSEQFARLSLAADEAPIGMERVRAHEMALRLAQANQSFAEEFVARIDLTQALYYVPDDPHTLVHFTWLRRALDPVHELEEDDRHAVLWRLKWAIDLIETLPEVPLSALVAAIDDVEEVYRAEGAALRPCTPLAPAWRSASATGMPSPASSVRGSPSRGTGTATAWPASTVGRAGWSPPMTRPGPSTCSPR